MKRLVIGILAHVDSGKTTLSEGMLYCAGEIRRLGRVDHGDAFLDTHEIERDRGITIFSKQAVLKWKDTEFTLLDTPGHIDFSAETERTLGVLDYAVLVISGIDGVQNHTETLWRLLKRYNVPAFLFINKMDISAHSRAELMEDIKKRLGGGCVDFTERGEEFNEDAAMCSEELMESFLENGLIKDEQIRRAILNRKIFPCYFGTALKNSGVEELLNGIDTYTSSPEYGSEFGARVFKISEDEQGARLTHMKITGGSLKVKTLLSGGYTEKWSEKVNAVRIYSGTKFKAVDEVCAGQICAVTGLAKTYAGEGLGADAGGEQPVLEPVLSYRVELPDGVDSHTMLEKLRKLEEEDPELHIDWNERHQEIHVRIMGEVQLEVLKRIISERFKIEVEFGQGSIAYKETISAPVEGVGHYEPLRHYAEVHLLMEPLERGSGLVFETSCSEDVLGRNWQRLIMTHLEEKTHIGVLTGSPITDMKITLIAGRAHLKHTEGGDFRQATYRAVRHGLRRAENVMLEPWYEFRLEVPTENVGRAMNDIQQMGGEFTQPESDGEFSILCGSAPVDKMRSYHTDVTGYTRGRGRLSCSVAGYRECHNSDEVIEKIGYDCDADLENTADSVFCSHGAGFVVSWDEVTDYMNLDGLSFDDGDVNEQDVQAAARAYVERAATDKELMQIFEKTYGPVKREMHAALRTKKQTSAAQKTFKAKPLPKGPEYLLVDGYNIIFAWDELKAAASESLDFARNRLINILSNYQGYRQCEVILVFDAYKVKGNPGSVERVDNISVVYTREAETADMYIEKVTHEIGRKHRVRVATSDNLEQIIILGAGAVRVSADAFKKEVDLAEKEIRKFMAIPHN